MPFIRQTDFLGGELDPLLWGRTDLERFRRGLRTCNNAFISQQGAFVSRPGTSIVAEARDADVRLIPFLGPTENYVLELSPGFIRFHAWGLPVLKPSLGFNAQVANFTVGATLTGAISGAVGVITEQVDAGVTGVLYFEIVSGVFQLGEQITDDMGGDATAGAFQPSVIYEVATPYTASDLPDIQYAQLGDKMILTHPGWAPRELTRIGRNQWTIATLTFDRPPEFAPADVRLCDTRPDATLLTSSDATHPAREWSYMASKVMKTSDGIVYETAPTPVTLTAATPAGATTGNVPNSIAVYQDGFNVTVMFRNLGLTQDVTLALRIYRGRGELWGWIGDIELPAAATATFTDTGLLPDYARPPPRGENPFAIYDTVGWVRTEDPYAVCYFQGRRIFAATSFRRSTIFASALEDYDNFDRRKVQVAGEGLTFELASRRRETIRALVPLDRLLALSDVGIWAIQGHEGEPLDFDSIDARVVEEIGARNVRPVVVDGSMLYVRAKGTGVRALVTANTRAGYEGFDISTPSNHLFQGVNRHVVDWCYAEDPWGVVWAVKADGSFLSLTYSLAGKHWAWARHSTAGQAKSICCIPEGNEDRVYMAVSRERFGGGWASFTLIERMGTRNDEGGVDDAICLDGAIRVVQSPISTTVTGLGLLEGLEVWVTAKDNPPRGPFTVTAGQITLGELPTANSGGATCIMHVGLLYHVEAETLDVASADQRLRQKSVVRVGVEVNSSKGLMVGPDFDHLKEWRQRSVAAGYAVPSAATEVVIVDVPGRWDQNARLAIRQTLPLPLTIVGVVREVEAGG